MIQVSEASQLLQTCALRHQDRDESKIFRTPEHLIPHLAPAEWVIYEWTPYVLEWPGATSLRIGSQAVMPIVPGVFPFSFENQLGLATIRAYANDRPLDRPLHLEVIAGKFSSPSRSVDYLQRTLADLFARMSSVPFVVSAQTERMVRESQAPPSPLFAFHFFRHHGTQLIRAIQAILGRPHQVLGNQPEMVRPDQVRTVDQETLIGLLRSSSSSAIPRHDRIEFLTPALRVRPERVLQRVPIESLDTPENRFVVSVVRRLLGAIRGLEQAKWYQRSSVDQSTRNALKLVAESFEVLLGDSRFSSLGPMSVVPAHSRVLQRRDGYHELSALWQVFQRSRKPMFEHLQNAIDLRNVADLYEFWVWFQLIDRFREITGVEPAHLPVPDDFGVPGWKSSVRFAGHGVLHYNKTYRGYSGIWLRPDFVWSRDDGATIVMDAKFRMQQPTEILTESAEEPRFLDDQKVKADDLQKMHTYRDAIRGVQAAIVLYPGHVSAFRDSNSRRYSVGLENVVAGKLDGIGAIPLSPLPVSAIEESGQ